MADRWEGWEGAELARSLGLPGLEVHHAIPSTSDRVRELAGTGAAAWTGVLADAQTAGRGRRGRGWISPQGLGVWVSLLLPAGPLEVDGLMPLRLVSALARRLEAAGSPAPAVKWPNDLLLADGRKVAGILSERLALPDGGAALILGVGVNVLGVDPSAAPVAGALSDVWPNAARESVLEAVVEAVRDARASREPVLSGTEMEEWSRRDALLGREVVVESGDTVHRGRVRGIEPGGRLLLETSSGPLYLASGTVRRGSSGRP